MVSKLADLNIRPKLIILFLLSGMLPLLIARYYGSKLASGALMEKSFNHLAAIQTIRTGLARAWEIAFSGQPIIDTKGRLIAVIILQASPSMISNIMESRKGMGRTGESYLLNGEESKNRFELRSSLQTMGDGKYVIGFSLGKTLAYWEDAVKKGYEGGHGIYVDSSGKGVLAAYNKLDIFGMNWFLISKN